MKAEVLETTQRVLRITKTDSMGRSRDVREAMEKNDPRPHKLGEGTLEVHAICASEHSEFPKAMYRLALRKGVPAGDEQFPSFPMPFDLAQQCGLSDLGFRIINKTASSPGNVVVRLPYITRLVGAVKDDLTIDVEAARAEEAQLRKLGWVDHPSKIKGLPVAPAEEPFDPLPDEQVEVKAARAK